MFRQPILQRRFHFNPAVVGRQGNPKSRPGRGRRGHFAGGAGLFDELNDARQRAVNLVAGAAVDLQRLTDGVRHVLADDFGVLKFTEQKGFLQRHWI